jgi:hypothetical protein
MYCTQKKLLEICTKGISMETRNLETASECNQTERLYFVKGTGSRNTVEFKIWTKNN